MTILSLTDDEDPWMLITLIDCAGNFDLNIDVFLRFSCLFRAAIIAEIYFQKKKLNKRHPVKIIKIITERKFSLR